MSILDLSGTCLQGYIKADIDDLIDVFGVPGTMDKSNVHWNLGKALDVHCALYSYKEGGIPEGDHIWHIGGHCELAITQLCNKLDECGVDYLWSGR